MRADVVPLTGEQVSAEFDALSERVQWNALSAVNAAWHAFKCAIKFSEREHGIAASQDSAIRRLLGEDAGRGES